MTYTVALQILKLARWQRVRRFGALVRRKPREAWLLAKLAFWTVAVALLMKRIALPRLLAWVSPRPRRQSHQPVIAPQRAAFWLDRLLSLNVWVFTPICWKRALVLHRVLGRDGIQTRIMFGVRKPPPSVGNAPFNTAVPTLDGHAWLECEDRPLLEHEPPDYVVTYSFPR